MVEMWATFLAADLSSMLCALTSLLITGVALDLVCNYLFKAYNRSIRHLNLRKSGWPPAHLDLDGDFTPRAVPEEDDGP